MFGDQRAPAGESDWAGERVSLEVNGEARAEGRMSYVMGRDPVQGVVWIANELLKYGYQLRAGDVVITGTVVEPPPIGAGDAARLTYSTLGTVELLVAEGGEYVSLGLAWETIRIIGEQRVHAKRKQEVSHLLLHVVEATGFDRPERVWRYGQP